MRHLFSSSRDFRHAPTATFCPVHTVAAPGDTLGDAFFIERTAVAAGAAAQCPAAPDLAGVKGLPPGVALICSAYAVIHQTVFLSGSSFGYSVLLRTLSSERKK